MATFFGIDIQDIVQGALTGQVQQGVLVRNVKRPFDPDQYDSPILAEERYPFEGFIGGSKQDTFSSGASMTTKMVTILGGSINIRPEANDRLEIADSTYTVSRVRYDFTEAVYECMVGG